MGMCTVDSTKYLVNFNTGRMRGQKVPSDLFHPWVRYCYKSDGDEKDALDKPEERGIEVQDPI